MIISTYMCLITFNIDGLNSPRKHKTQLYAASQDSHFRCNETDRDRGMIEKDAPCKWETKKLGGGISIANQTE